MLRKILLVASASLLLLSSVAAPAVAQSGAKVRDLNAIPGTRIDVCVAGEGEVTSNLGYGRFSETGVVPAGTWTIQVRVASTGTCRGTKLLSKQVTFAEGKDYTIVYWKPTLNVALKVFENDLTLPAADAVTLTMRHMAKAGPIDVWVWRHVGVEPSGYFDPTFDDLARGQQSATLVLDERQTMLEAFPARETRLWSYEYLWTYLFAGGAYQVYFIGNARSNFMIAIIGQAGVFTPVP